MDGFDDLMDWGGDDITPDDIGAYVAAKQEKRRLRDAREAFAPPAKLYGYQEPKSVVKPRPRVVHSLDNGGWDSSRGTGRIPTYSWQDDPLRRKRVPGTSPRDQSRGRRGPGQVSSAPTASRTRSMPLASGRAPGRALPPLPQRQVPGRTSSLPPIKRAPNAPMARPAADRTPAPSGRRADSEPLDEEDVPVPPQHPYRGALAKAQAPQLKRTTVSAYSAPVASRPKLPPLRVPGQRGVVRSSRGVSQSPRAKVPPTKQPTRAAPQRASPRATTLPMGEDGGEAVSARRQTAGSVASTADTPTRGDSQSPRAPPPDPEPTALEIAQARLMHLKLQIVEERQLREELAASKVATEDGLAAARAETQRLKSTMTKSQKSQKALVTAERERTQLQATCRKLDAQLKDFRNMAARMAGRRDELRAERVSMPVAAGATVEEEMGDRLMLRDTSRAKDELKRSIERLTEQRTYLSDELARVTAEANDRQQREAIIRDRILRERRAAVDELKARLDAELERELARVRDTHMKAHRHREREIETRAAAGAAQLSQADQKLASAKAGGFSSAKHADDARTALRVQQSVVDELSNSLDTKRARAGSLADALASKRQKCADAAAKIRSLEKQREVAGPSPAASPTAGANARERADIERKLAALSQEERETADAISHLEREQAQLRSSIDDITQRAADEANNAMRSATQAQDQAKARRADAGDLVKKAKARVAAAKKQVAEFTSKDAEIERLTKQLAVATSSQRDLHRENERLLARLDQAERLISMSALH